MYCIFSHDKNLPNPKMTVCTTFKSSKIFYDTGDLENMVLSLYILGVNIKSVTHMVTDLWTFAHSIGYDGKIQLLTHKIQK